MLSNQFVILVLAAKVIAWPIVRHFMNAWLSHFAYRIDLNLTCFLTAGSMAVLIAVLTVSYQSIKAALVNPADTLRNE